MVTTNVKHSKKRVWTYLPISLAFIFIISGVIKLFFEKAYVDSGQYIISAFLLIYTTMITHRSRFQRPIPIKSRTFPIGLILMTIGVISGSPDGIWPAGTWLFGTLLMIIGISEINDICVGKHMGKSIDQNP